MSLIRRLYLLASSSILLMLIVFFTLYASWNRLNSTLIKSDYTQNIETMMGDLQILLLRTDALEGAEVGKAWLMREQHISALLEVAPQFEPQEQTLFNSIVSQNGSLIILFKKRQELQHAKYTQIKRHLFDRLLMQIKSIREDCVTLQSEAQAEFKKTIKKLFFSLSLFLLLGIAGISLGLLNIGRLLRTSIKDIQMGMKHLEEGNFKPIQLSIESNEFEGFVNKFNEMSHHLEKTTVSRDSLQKIVEQRTEALRKIAVTDYLTGLLSRRALFERGESEFSRAKRHQRALALLMIDCDFFKKVNDQYGHLIGDKVLVNLAAILKKEIRGADIAGRFGGEEFLIVLTECGQRGAIEIAQRIQAELANSFVVANAHENEKINVTVSIGIAVYHHNYNNFAALVDATDKALYQAKDSGRNCIKVYSLE